MSGTHSCQCVQYFHVSEQWYGRQRLGLLTGAQMLMHTIARRGCTDTIREPALKVDWEKNPLPHQGLEPASVLRLACLLDILLTELFPLRDGDKDNDEETETMPKTSQVKQSNKRQKHPLVKTLE